MSFLQYEVFVSPESHKNPVTRESRRAARKDKVVDADLGQLDSYSKMGGAWSCCCNSHGYFLFRRWKRKGIQGDRLKNAIVKVEKFKREQYLKKKAWYEHQLNYNDLNEWAFTYTKDIAHLYLSSMNGREVKITYLPEPGLLEYSPSIAKGYAQELIFARMFIENFEHPERLKEDEDKDNSIPEVINEPCADNITIKKGKTLTVESTVSGELTVERGGVLKLAGISQGKIFVADGGRLELSGTSTGNINNKGTTIANGMIAGTLYNHGRLEIYGMVSGRVTNYAWGKCIVDKAATITGNGKIIHEK